MYILNKEPVNFPVLLFGPIIMKIYFLRHSTRAGLIPLEMWQILNLLLLIYIINIYLFYLYVFLRWPKLMSCNTALNNQNKNTFKPSRRGSTNYFSGMCSLLQIPSREHPQLCCDVLRGRGFHPTWQRNPVLEPCVEPELCCLVKAALRCSGASKWKHNR